MQLQERFREKLREALEIKGWSQSDLARHLDMTPQTVGSYFHGRRSPGLDFVEKVAIALDIKPSNLLDDAPLEILQTTV